ncbi:MAG: glycoside hydrolase family 1 protein [Candidatus Omnitrophica bacterium]|jgi:beta-glucosidase|nr:glycoside hydrolase family 1 protein [Candidatus Omnitrophota bacterium]
MLKFPEGFLWGASCSSYQVEGNNNNSDWREWEIKSGKQRSGDACKHYQLYEKDFEIARSLNHNAHRLSLEWARIQPTADEFSSEEIKHYAQVLDALKKRGIKPVVTLHHFTNPLWFAAIGGWLCPKSAEYFAKYVHYVVEHLGEKVCYWVTINEPLVYSYHSFAVGAWPPQEKSFSKARQVENNFALAHQMAYRVIHDFYKKNNLPSAMVSIAHNIQAFVPCPGKMINAVASFIRDKYYNYSFLNRLFRAKTLDYIGINYYTRQLVEMKGWLFRNLVLDVCTQNHSRLPKNYMGWDIYPQGLLSLLCGMKKYNLPIVILENGVCLEDDTLRWEFIRSHLEQVLEAIKQGAKVKGYFYWSLLDNFEWDKGFAPRFGLVKVDYNTFEREIRPSALKYALVCKENCLSRRPD